jgi:hypothetical protein
MEIACQSGVIKTANKQLFVLVRLKRANVPAKDLINFYTTCTRFILDIWRTSFPLYAATISSGILS